MFKHTQGQVSVSMNLDPINKKNWSTINDKNMKTKTPKNNPFEWDVLRKQTHRNNLLKDVLNFNHVITITSEI